MSLRNALLVLVPVSLACLHLVWLADRLPELVSSHFDSAGKPDGWSGRGFFLGIFGGMQLGIAVLFLGLCVFLRKLPIALINLPNKDYWLADERRKLTMDWIGGYLAVNGGATALLLLGAVHLTAIASQSPEGTLDNAGFLFVTGGYLAFVVCGLVVLCLHFKRPKSSLEPR